jgi:nitric oxide dioxygenase
MSHLTPTQVLTIKATVPVLADHGVAITTKFYADMIDAHQELKNIFNTTHQATGHQARALAGALYAYAANIDDLGALSPALELICHKHVSLFIRPEQYAIVGTHLLATMKSVLGDAATPDIMDAWGAAYWQLANIMIGKEDGMYAATRYWADWKDFVIARKVRESDEITSFYLRPVEAEFEIPMFKPGQYVSVNVWVEELDAGVWQARQYSLSDAPGKEYLRISVKKEPGIEIGEKKHTTHPGYISNLLHETKGEGDVVRLSHPFGDFYCEEKEEGEGDAPVVLISAGVGLTCLTSILNSTVEKKSRRPVSWIHGARNEKTRAFKDHVDQLEKENENVHTVYFSSEPMVGEVQGRDFDIEGRIDLEKLDRKVLFTDNDKTQYFICGPTQFMLDVEEKLKSYGVPSERVKMELFGTGGVPRA